MNFTTVKNSLRNCGEATDAKHYKSPLACHLWSRVYRSGTFATEQLCRRLVSTHFSPAMRWWLQRWYRNTGSLLIPYCATARRAAESDVYMKSQQTTRRWCCERQWWSCCRQGMIVKAVAATTLDGRTQCWPTADRHSCYGWALGFDLGNQEQAALMQSRDA